MGERLRKKKKNKNRLYLALRHGTEGGERGRYEGQGLSHTLGIVWGQEEVTIK